MRDGRTTAFELVVTENFDREFSKLRNAAMERRIWRKVRALEEDPLGGSPLVGTEDSEFGRLYRLRIGDYRVVYAVRHEARRVILLHVGHRKNVYRGR